MMCRDAKEEQGTANVEARSFFGDLHPLNEHSSPAQHPFIHIMNSPCNNSGLKASDVPG